MPHITPDRRKSEAGCGRFALGDERTGRDQADAAFCPKPSRRPPTPSWGIRQRALHLAALADGFVEDHGGGDGNVQAVGRAEHRQSHGLNPAGRPQAAQPFRFAAEDHR